MRVATNSSVLVREFRFSSEPSWNKFSVSILTLGLCPVSCHSEVLAHPRCFNFKTPTVALGTKLHTYRKWSCGMAKYRDYHVILTSFWSMFYCKSFPELWLSELMSWPFHCWLFVLFCFWFCFLIFSQKAESPLLHLSPQQAFHYFSVSRLGYSGN